MAFLATYHDLWRDEARVLSITLAAGGPGKLMAAVRYEGHPPLWYFMVWLLRAVVPGELTLQVCAFLVAAGAVLILLVRSPFTTPVLILLLAARFSAFEYSVMARNYGISMLVLFAFAGLTLRQRGRTFVPGLLLAVLSNCNVHSIVLAMALLGYWALELLWDREIARANAWRLVAVNALLALAGAAFSLNSVYPTAGDGIPSANHVSATGVLKAALLPGGYMRDLVFPGSHRVPFLSSGSWEMAMTVIASLLLFGSTLGLRRKPAAMAAALLSLLAFSVLFAQFYPGGYRHEALWLVFLVSLYWMTFQSAPEPPWPQPDASVRVGTLAFVLLLGIQLSGTVLKVADVVSGAPPSSRARDFAGFMRTHPEFSDSVVLADPEYLLDTVSHYARNRTYLMRQQRYGRFALFTRSARQRLSLQEILNIASQIRADSGKPVLILLSFRLARIDGTGSRRPEITRAGSYAEGYSWKLDVTPDQIDRFLDATELLVEYPPALTDESFDVYVLR